VDTCSLTATSLIRGQISSLNTTTDTAILLYENPIGNVTMLLQRLVVLPPPWSVVEFEWDDITSQKSPSVPNKFRDSPGTRSHTLYESAANNITFSTPFASSVQAGYMSTDAALVVDLVFYSPFSTAPVNSEAPISDGMLIRLDFINSPGPAWVAGIYCHPRFPDYC